jgi:hypothetical protein
MLTTVEGWYENGRVELAERPAGVERAKVYVTFVVDTPVPTVRASPEAAHAEAVDQWLASLREGLPLGGPPYPTRDELHDRGR